ncbi:hypothetical protein CSOJ01_05676 [Colletotrichum sojae]|uniref:Uncharacterized protein n=1 Tax=Colletotrichum sojae TaxID=2175907 RepID=A0A8H6JEM5_9PEZI|nr:hypothetical protein CSOJ01_05676 [Colletotrichum sojae]
MAIPENNLLCGTSSDSAGSKETGEKHDCQPFVPLSKFQALLKLSFEVFALLLSTSALAAIIVTLKKYDGRPPPESTYLNVNTLVAIFSTILRATVAYVVAEVIGQSKWRWMQTARPLRHLEKFHNASMGPWGSFQLLFLTWKPSVNILSAIVIILSAAIGPFSQQAATNNVCHGSKLHGYAAWVRIASSQQSSMEYYPARIATAINGLMYGASDSSAATSSLFQCRSSNCTFGDDYPAITHASIGICSSCTDVISGMKEIERGGDTYHQFAEGTKFSVSMSERFLDMSVTLESPRESSLYGGLYGDNITVSTITLRSRGNPIAANCTIYPCIRYYNANVTDGLFNESVISQAPMELHQAGDDPMAPMAPTDFFFIALMDPCFIDGRRYSKLNISSDRLSRTWKTHHSTFRAPAECVRYIDPSFYGSLYSFLHEAVAGSCGPNPFGGGPTGCDQNKWWISALFRERNATFESISGAFDGMATAITNQMRAEMGLVVPGRETKTYICLRVNWLWLLYPAALLILATIALVGAIGQSLHHRGRLPVWKSQILPLLFYNVGTQQAQGSFESVPLLQVDQMEALADKTRARFNTRTNTVGFIVVEKADSVVTAPTQQVY